MQPHCSGTAMAATSRACEPNSPGPCPAFAWMCRWRRRLRRLPPSRCGTSSPPFLRLGTQQNREPRPNIGQQPRRRGCGSLPRAGCSLSVLLQLRTRPRIAAHKGGCRRETLLVGEQPRAVGLGGMYRTQDLSAGFERTGDEGFTGSHIWCLVSCSMLQGSLQQSPAAIVFAYVPRSLLGCCQT